MHISSDQNKSQRVNDIEDEHTNTVQQINAVTLLISTAHCSNQVLVIGPQVSPFQGLHAQSFIDTLTVKQFRNGLLALPEICYNTALLDSLRRQCDGRLPRFRATTDFR